MIAEYMALVNESDADHQDNIIYKSNGTLCSSKVTVEIFINDVLTSILFGSTGTKVSAVQLIRLAFAARSVTSRFTATTFH